MLGRVWDMVFVFPALFVLHVVILFSCGSLGFLL